MNLQRIGVLAHPYRPTTAPIAEQIASSLRARGLDVWIRTAWDATSARSVVEGSDLVVSIGGDGAMLRTARLCAPLGVPILGVNAGRLGFLTEVEIDAWDAAEERLVNDDYWIEDRMMIRCEIWDNHASECRETEHALNDVVIGRGALARSVLLDTYVDDIWTTTFNADGLIIATPTGSTAYALAVGGPLMPPELRTLLMIPVAPHLSMDRAIVVSDDDRIKVMVAPRSFDPEVVVTIDGELVASLSVNDYIIVSASDKVSSFIRMRERGYFFRSILDRLEPRLANRHPSDNGN